MQALALRAKIVLACVDGPTNKQGRGGSARRSGDGERVECPVRRAAAGRAGR